MLCPRPVSVTPLNDYKLYIVFDDGKKGIFDVTPYIGGDWFGKLRDKSFFKTVRITNKHIEWLDGQDIAPHELYENCSQEASSDNTPK